MKRSELLKEIQAYINEQFFLDGNMLSNISKAGSKKSLIQTHLKTWERRTKEHRLEFQDYLGLPDSIEEAEEEECM